MTTINLLPWREKLRERDKNRFISICGVVIALALLLNIVCFFIQSGKVSHQLKRNAFLQAQIQTVKTAVAQQKKLDEKKTDLLAQMKVLMKLNNQRMMVAELLNKLPQLLPENVTLNNISILNNQVTLIGEAPISTQASTLVGSIEEQPEWLKTSVQEIASSSKSSSKSLFRITFEME